MKIIEIVPTNSSEPDRGHTITSEPSFIDNKIFSSKDRMVRQTANCTINYILSAVFLLAVCKGYILQTALSRRIKKNDREINVLEFVTANILYLRGQGVVGGGGGRMSI